MPTAASPPHPPSTGSPEAATDLVAALEELSRAQREAASQVARELGWPRAGLGVVRLLDRHGRLQLGDLACRLRVDASVASRQVGALVDAGYVRRTVGDDDRRARTVELTAAGSRLAEAMTEHLAHLVSTAFADWSGADITEATEQIRSVAAALARSNDKEPDR